MTSKRTKERTDAEWKTLLSAVAYQVLREAGTERAFTGEFWDHHELGTYVCGGCDTELFVSDMKFDSGCGWPSFFEEIGDGSRVEKRVDSSHGMTRTEIICTACGGHLGHVFDDGPPPTGKRYCVNSLSLRFVPAGK